MAGRHFLHSMLDFSLRGGVSGKNNDILLVWIRIIRLFFEKWGKVLPIILSQRVTKNNNLIRLS